MFSSASNEIFIAEVLVETKEPSVSAHASQRATWLMSPGSDE